MGRASQRWDGSADELLAAVLAGVPAFVRGMVRRVVRAESERLARDAGAAGVGPEHVREAFRLRTPGPMRGLLLRALGEPGPPGAVESPEFAVGEPMTSAEIDAFLAWEGTGRLGTIDAEGRPYVVPLSFVHDSGCVYYHWFSEDGRKTRAVARHRQVCFEADWATRDQLSYRSVIGDGELDEVVDSGERRRILALLAAKFPAYATGAGHSAEIADVIGRGDDAMAEAVRIFRVRFSRLTGKKKGPGPAGADARA